MSAAGAGDGGSAARSLWIGLGLMLLTQAQWAMWGATLKYLVLDGVPMALCFVARPIAALLLLAPWMLRAGARGIATQRLPLHALRSLAGVTSTGAQLVAVVLIPFADAVAVTYAKPLWVIPLAVLFLGERVGWRRSLATAVGFVGVLIVAGPRGVVSPGVLAAVLSGVAGAAVMLMIKSLTSTEPAGRILFYYSALSLLVWGPLAAFHWATPNLFQFALLALSGAIVLLGDYLMTRAVRYAEASVLAPMDYSQVPMAAALGAILFGEEAGWSLAIGTALMVGAVWYIARREAMLLRRAAAARASLPSAPARGPSPDPTP